MQQINGQLKKLFEDEWGEFERTHPHLVTQNIRRNVAKMQSCRSPKMGCHVYTCPENHTKVIVPHTCKSRFCSSCGVEATNRWSDELAAMIHPIPCKLITFTIPQQLRAIVRANKKILIGALFRASSEAVLSYGGEHGFLPGMTSVLHTFGTKLNFHPHIHMIATCGGLDESRRKWIPYDYFSTTALSERFKTLFVREVRESFGRGELHIPPGYSFPDARDLNAWLGKNFQKFWHTHASGPIEQVVTVIGYVGRYTKRPPISEARIVAVKDGQVTFLIKDWQIKGRQIPMTLSIEKFLKELIQHIPEKSFPIIRHYGFFSTRLKGKLLPKVKALLARQRHTGGELAHLPKTPQPLSWRERRTQKTGVDPLVCPRCGLKMGLAFVFYPGDLKGIDTFDELARMLDSP